jgi:hypothetical protein
MKLPLGCLSNAFQPKTGAKYFEGIAALYGWKNEGQASY